MTVSELKDIVEKGFKRLDKGQTELFNKVDTIRNRCIDRCTDAESRISKMEQSIENGKTLSAQRFGMVHAVMIAFLAAMLSFGGSFAVQYIFNEKKQDRQTRKETRWTKGPTRR